MREKNEGSREMGEKSFLDSIKKENIVEDG